MARLTLVELAAAAGTLALLAAAAPMLPGVAAATAGVADGPLVVTSDGSCDLT